MTEEKKTDLEMAAEAMVSVLTNHIIAANKTKEQAKAVITNQDHVINALKLTQETMEAKLADSAAEAPENFSYVACLRNLKNMCEGSTVNKATHTLLEDAWFKISEVLLSEEEFTEHFLKKQ